MPRQRSLVTVRLQMLPELGLEVPSTCARVRAWCERLAARPSWRRTMYPPLAR